MTLRKQIAPTLFALFAGLSTVHAQLVFSPDKWDFGTIQETEGKVSHTFTATNNSDKPVVILDAVTTCGCTVPKFSKEPVRPGQTAEITITYDPANRPGIFEKKVDLYGADRQKIAALTIRGKVVPRPKSIEERYAVDAGGGLRLDRNYCPLGYIRQGQTVQFTVGYINDSTRPIRLELDDEGPSRLLTATYPHEIAAGTSGEINLMYRIPDGELFYGTIRNTLGIYVDGRSNGAEIETTAIGIDKPQAGPAGKLQLSTHIVRFGTVKHDAPVQRRTFTLTNTGAGQLFIRAIETGGKISAIPNDGQQIPAGESFTAEAMLDPEEQDYGTMADYITLITNDPDHPMQRLRVVAIIEQ